MSKGITSSCNDYSANQINQGELLQTIGKTHIGKIVEQKLQENMSSYSHKLYRSNIGKNLTDKTKNNFHNRIANFFKKGREDALKTLQSKYKTTQAKDFLDSLKIFSKTPDFKSLPKSTQKIINNLLYGKLGAKIHDKTKNNFHNRIANFFNKGREAALNKLKKQQSSKEFVDFIGSEDFKNLPKKIQQAVIEDAKENWGADFDLKKSNPNGDQQINAKKQERPQKMRDIANELKKEIERKNIQDTHG